MKSKNQILTIVGFLLFLFGFIAVVLSLIGLQLQFLSFLEIPGRLFGFVIKLLMIFVGMSLFYVARTSES